MEFGGKCESRHVSPSSGGSVSVGHTGLGEGSVVGHIF